MSKANDVTENEFVTLSRLFKKGTSTQLEGLRKAHEAVAGSTSMQMIMAGVFKDATPDEYNNAPNIIDLFEYFSNDSIGVIPKDNVMPTMSSPATGTAENMQNIGEKRTAVDNVAPPPKRSEISGEASESITIRRGDPNKIIAAQQAQKWQYFKKFYSWFSGVKIHREVKDNTTSLSDENEDEHVIPFGFMLLFGGGLARMINKDNYNKQIDVKRSSRDWPVESDEFIDWLLDIDEDIKTDTDKTRGKRQFNMMNVPKKEDDTKRIEAETKRVQIIEKYGMDIGEFIWLYNDHDARVILECLGYNTEGQIAEFCRNMFNINYYGYFLSEGKANSVKSDHLFVKLERDTQEGTIKFSEAVTRVQDFNNEIFAWAKCFKIDECEELSKIVKSRRHSNENRTGENIVYKTPGLSSKWLPKGIKMISKFCEDKHKDVGFRNMIYILKKLCHYLNKDITNRIIFNILMTRIYRYKKAQKVGLANAKGPGTTIKSQQINYYKNWIKTTLDILVNDDDSELIGYLKSELDKLDSYTNLKPTQIDTIMKSVSNKAKDMKADIVELEIISPPISNTAEGFAEGSSLLAQGTPNKFTNVNPENTLDIGSPTLQPATPASISEDDFELHFFNAYLETRPKIRETFRSLITNDDDTGGPVVQALDELDREFFKGMQLGRRPRTGRKRNNVDYEGADGDEEEDEDEDVNEPGSTGPGSGINVVPRRLGFGGRKTRKRKQKRLFRRGGPQR